MNNHEYVLTGIKYVLNGINMNYANAIKYGFLP